MAELAKTSARLSPSITLRALKEDLTIDVLNDVNALRALAEKSVIIGGIVSMSEDNTRTSNPRYELDADQAGKMKERTPALEDFSLTLNRAVLYKSDMLEALGFDDAQSLIDQNTPFIVVKEERTPTGSGIPTRTTMWTGCWMHNNPKTYDLGGDLRIMQNVEIGATNKVRV